MLPVSYYWYPFTPHVKELYKIESMTWSMEHIFPNFNKHKKIIEKLKQFHIARFAKNLTIDKTAIECAA